MAKPKDVWQTAMARQQLRSADDTLTAAVAATIDALSTTDADKAAVELAKHYAAAIDAGHCSECGADTTLDTLGPKLLAALDALGATPAARNRLKGGGTDERPGRLHALRADRRTG